MSEIAKQTEGRYFQRDGTPLTNDEAHKRMKELFDDDYRRIGFDTVTFRGMTYDVSTVFLVINHQYGDGPPLIFETMIFIHGSSHDEYMQRYSTEDEAVAGHRYIVDTLRRNELPDLMQPQIERP